MVNLMLCPICKARNESGPQCRRCRADLSALFVLETCRAQMLVGATRAAAAGRWEEGGAAATAASEQRRDADSQRLLAVCALMRRDFATAWKIHEDISATQNLRYNDNV
jgi:hypothetical protein